MNEPSPEELSTYRLALEKMAEWARKHPGTAGEPASLADGGPGDSDCISVYLASVFYAAGQKVRLVFAAGDGMGDHGVFVEVFHRGFGREGLWIAVLPFAPFIFEGPQILASKRILECEL
jgi:hypothetical protein